MTHREDEPQTEQLETDTQEARLVGDYLDLIDRFGPDDSRVKEFLAQHSDVPELGEWQQVVAGLPRPGKAPRREVAGRILGGLLVLVGVGLAVLGMQHTLQLGRLQTELSSAKTTLTSAEKQKAQLQTNLTLAQTRLAEIERESERWRKKYDRVVTRWTAESRSGASLEPPPFEPKFARRNDLPDEPGFAGSHAPEPPPPSEPALAFAPKLPPDEFVSAS